MIIVFKAVNGRVSYIGQGRDNRPFTDIRKAIEYIERRRGMMLTGDWSIMHLAKVEETIGS